MGEKLLEGRASVTLFCGGLTTAAKQCDARTAFKKLLFEKRMEEMDSLISD